MNDGDFVSGVPSAPQMRRKFPRIFGTYETVTFKVLGKPVQVGMIVTQGVHVSCDDIKPANQRRNKETDINA